MRPALLVWALGAFVLSTVTAAKGDKKVEDGSTPADPKAVQYTTFNGIKVPPMTDINGPDFAETIKSGYW